VQPPPVGGQAHGDAQPHANMEAQFAQFLLWQQFMQQHAAAQPHVAHPERVKLPPLHVSRPRTWFTLAESSFEQQHVVDSRSKFNLVVLALNDDQIRRVAAITEHPELYEDPYLAIKERLLEIFQPSKWANVHSLLTFKELGGMQPSALMDEMLALLPEGEVPGAIFKGIFLARLPQDMRDHVQSRADDLECPALAKLADNLYDSRNAAKAKVLAALPLPPAPDTAVDSIVESVAAVQIKKTGGDRRYRDGRQGGRQERDKGRSDPQRSRQQREPARPPPGLCQYHYKFGSGAYSCKDPQNCLLAPGN